MFILIFIGVLTFFIIIAVISWKLFFKKNKKKSKKKKMSKEVNAIYLKAREELERGNIDSYINLLHQANLKDPLNPDLKRELAYAYFENGFFSKAKFELNNYLKLEKDEKKILETLDLIFQIAYQSGNLKEAFQTALRITILNPLDVEKLNFLGLVLGSSRRYDEAIEYLNKAIEQDPNNKTTYFYRGVIFASRNWKNEAIKELEKALELGNKEPIIYFILGLMYRDKDKGKSISYYEKAIADMEKLLAPETSIIIKSMIFCAIEFMILQEWKRAIKILSEVTKIDVHDVIIRRDLYYHLGFCYIMTKQINRAIEAWNQLILVDESFTEELEQVKFNLERAKPELEKKWYERIKELKIDFFQGLLPARVIINYPEELKKAKEWFEQIKGGNVDLKDIKVKKVTLKNIPEIPQNIFKKTVLKTAKKLGYEPLEEIYVSNDNIEILAKEKKALGNKKILIVFKRSKNESLGALVIGEVLESMKKANLKEAILISNVPYSDKAKKTAKKYKIKLIGPNKLEKLLAQK